MLFFPLVCSCVDNSLQQRGIILCQSTNCTTDSAFFPKMYNMTGMCVNLRLLLSCRGLFPSYVLRLRSSRVKVGGNRVVSSSRRNQRGSGYSQQWTSLNLDGSFSHCAERSHLWERKGVLSLPTAALFVLKTGSVDSLITNATVLLLEISLTLGITQHAAVGLGGASE